MRTIGTTTSRAGRSRLRTVIGLIAAVVMTLSLVAPGSAGATGGGQSGGVSANPVFGPLSAKWWQWRVAHPFSDTHTDPSTADCDKSQTGSVFFLSGTFGDGPGVPVERKCTVPYGKSLFFPLFNIANFATETNETAQILWEDIHVDKAWTVSTLSLKIGGIRLLKDSPPNAIYRGCAGPERGCTPRSFSAVIGGEEYEPAIADGYYALIPPLPRGKVTIKFGGTGSWIPNAKNPVVEHLAQDLTYELTIK